MLPFRCLYKSVRLFVALRLFPFGLVSLASVTLLNAVATPKAQSVPPANSQTPMTDARIALNPILAEVQRAMPAQLPLVLAKLNGLSARPASGSRGGDTKPTAAEALQIAHNPAFAKAYDHDPENTLVLLRYINSKVR